MDDEPGKKLTAAAIVFVSYRLRTEKEIRDFLHKKIVRMKLSDPTVADAVVHRLNELGYVNDEQFAADWVASRFRTKQKGSSLLLRELAAKGIAKELAAAVTARAMGSDSGDTERKLAAEALHKKIARWVQLPRLEFRKKAFGYLLRRGFSGSTASHVIDETIEKNYNTSQAGTDSSEYYR